MDKLVLTRKDELVDSSPPEDASQGEEFFPDTTSVTGTESASKDEFGKLLRSYVKDVTDWRHDSVLMLENIKQIISEQLQKENYDAGNALTNIMDFVDKHLQQIESTGSLQQNSVMLLNGFSYQQLKLRQKQNEVELSKQQVDSLKAANKQLRVSMTEMNELAEEIQYKLEDSQQQLSQLKIERLAIEKDRDRLAFELNESRSENSVLNERLREFEASCQALSTDKLKTVQQLSATAAECDEAKRAFSLLIEQAGLRTREEVQLATSSLESKLNSLSSSFDSQQQEIADKQALIDRYVRERKSISAELDRFKEEASKQLDEQTNKVSTLTNRAITAESARQSATLRAEHLENAVKGLEKSERQLREYSEKRVAELEQRLAKSVAAFTSLRQEHQRVLESSNELKQTARRHELEKVEHCNKLELELRRVNAGHAASIQEYEARITGLNSAHATALEESKKLLLDQLSAAARSQKQADETKIVQHTKINEHLSEMASLRRSNRDISDSLAECKLTLSRYSNQLQQKESEISSLRNNLRSSESKLLSLKSDAARSATDMKRESQKKLIQQIKDRINSFERADKIN